jgi:hypothetical protein
MEYQNVPDSVKFSHLSLALMMLFDLGNKLIVLYICHYQTPCRSDVSSDLTTWCEQMWQLSAALCTSHYKTKTTLPGICTLTAVETAEHLYK